MPSAPSKNSLAERGRRAVDAISALLLVAVVAVTLAQVGARYVFNWPMPWSDELTRLLFVWMVMIAAAGAAHMRLDYFVDRMSPRMRRAVGLGVGALCVALLAIMAWKSVGLIDLTRHDRYVALGISVQYLYWAALTGSTLWIVAIVANGIALWRGRH